MIDLLRSRRSIRKYTGKDIDTKSLEVLIEALLRSPSSRNIKPCEFVFVDDRDLLKKLALVRGHNSQYLEHAALGIVVCADEQKSDVWIEDSSIASILVQMTALSLGLGSCWIQIRNRMYGDKSAEAYVQGLLELPEHHKVLSIISIGYPDENKKPVAKSELNYRAIRRNQYSEYYESGNK